MVRTVAEIESEARASGGLSFAPRPKRVGIVADYAEERWPSMELVAELTSLGIARYAEGAFQPAILRPKLPRAGRRLPVLGEAAALNADRYLGRYLAYPRWLKSRVGSFDLFHVVDHSYAHLVHHLPAARTGVTCHDLDAFRSLQGHERRPWWFRATMRRVFTGLRAAAHVICDTTAVRDELAAMAGFDAGRLSVVPLPMHPVFGPEPDAGPDADAARLVKADEGRGMDLLHVGSTAPRKQLSLLVRVFAGVRERHPNARLIRVGALTPGLRKLARDLGAGDAIVELPHVDRRVLAAIYRRATALLITSEREGFGWPVLEAMACGTPVVASDIPPHREVGGEAAIYASPTDRQEWIEAVDTLLRDLRDPAERRGHREAVLERAHQFSLERYAEGLLSVYRGVLGMKG